MVFKKLDVIFLGFLSFVSLAECLKELPSYFPKCNIDDPPEKLNACMLEATETVRPYLRKGVPELNIPALDPLFIPEVTLEQGSSATNYKAYLKNLTLYGMGDYKFTKNEYDPKTISYYCEVFMPAMYMRGIYVVEGKLLNAPLMGEGIFYANITNSDGTLKIITRAFKKKGVEFVEPKEMITHLNIGNVIDYAIEGLFKDNEILAKATKKALDENLKLAVEEVKPAVEQVLTRFFRDVILKSIFRVPYKKLFNTNKT